MNNWYPYLTARSSATQFNSLCFCLKYKNMHVQADCKELCEGECDVCLATCLYFCVFPDAALKSVETRTSKPL